jgi:hypothetical protein
MKSRAKETAKVPWGWILGLLLGAVALGGLFIYFLNERRKAFWERHWGEKAAKGEPAKELLGSWDVMKESHGPGAPPAFYLSSSTLSGLDPVLDRVRVKATSSAIFFAGEAGPDTARHFCAGTIEPLGIGDHAVVVYECLPPLGDPLSWSVYYVSKAGLTSALTKQGSDVSPDALADIRGVWHSSDDKCPPPAESKRRTIVTRSVLHGNNGLEAHGLFLRSSRRASNGSVEVSGVRGLEGKDPCEGSIVKGNGSEHVITLRCEPQSDSWHTVLCRKATSWAPLY